MKEIMISIKPQWVEKILNHTKTIEIRKTKPKCELPCKVYIYCTKGKPYLYRIDDDNNFELTNKLRFPEDCFVKDYNAQNGKVVAEFTLNKVTKHDKNFIDFEGNICYNFKVCDVKNAGFDRDVFSLLDFDDFIEDYGKGKTLYGWHIDNLKTYNKPKELSEFAHWVVDCYGWKCKTNTRANCEVLEELTRPPQSWCYVEKVGK